VTNKLFNSTTMEKWSWISQSACTLNNRANLLEPRMMTLLNTSSPTKIQLRLFKYWLSLCRTITTLMIELSTILRSLKRIFNLISLRDWFSYVGVTWYFRVKIIQYIESILRIKVIWEHLFKVHSMRVKNY
jgi:hypothetical protein